MRKLILVLPCVVLAGWHAPRLSAEVTPHGLFTDNMVLQQGDKVPVWGTADPGEKVTVTIQEHKASATAGPDGKWLVRLNGIKAGGPLTLTIAGKNEVVLKNVLVGEVWLASGQSNMWWPVKLSRHPKEAAERSANPMLRLFTVPTASAASPQDKLPGNQKQRSGPWVESGPDTVPNFSAVGYFFGRDLQKARNVPVGIIHSSVGGTAAELWTPKGALEKDAALKDLKGSGLYNAMIAPLQPFAIKGVIWYQGESNADRARQYLTLFPTMIRSWRQAWGQGEFPFLFVQLAPWDVPKRPGQWAELREAQLLTTRLVPNTAMAVITDLGDRTDIHPKDKDPVGARLALAARALAYGEKIEYSGPIYDGMKVDGDKAIVRFKHTGGGLVAKGGPLTGFTVAGEDGKFVQAQAEIQDNTVVVHSTKVARPRVVRFGWANYPVVNLYNREGLPASPFRSDMPAIENRPTSAGSVGAQ